MFWIIIRWPQPTFPLCFCLKRPSAISVFKCCSQVKLISVSDHAWPGKHMLEVSLCSFGSPLRRATCPNQPSSCFPSPFSSRTSTHELPRTIRQMFPTSQTKPKLYYTWLQITWTRSCVLTRCLHFAIFPVRSVREQDSKDNKWNVFCFVCPRDERLLSVWFFRLFGGGSGLEQEKIKVLECSFKIPTCLLKQSLMCDEFPSRRGVNHQRY